MNKKKTLLICFLFGSVIFTAILFVRSIVYNVSVSDQIETMARSAEKWGNECAWLP